MFQTQFTRKIVKCWAFYVKLVLISLLSSAHPIDAAIYEDSKQMTKTAAAGWAGL